MVAAASGPVWFQLYVYRDRAVTEALIRRVEAAGVQAIVLTVDVPLLSVASGTCATPSVLPDGLTLANVSAGLERLPEVADSGLAAYFASLWRIGGMKALLRVEGSSTSIRGIMQEAGEVGRKELISDFVTQHHL